MIFRTERKREQERKLEQDKKNPCLKNKKNKKNERGPPKKNQQQK